MNNKSYIVAIDLGESSVIVVVGSKNYDGLMTIESVVNQPSEGVKAGTIENIALVGEAIKRAVEMTEEKLQIRIVEAYAGISGEFVRFACHTDHVYVTDPVNGVSQNDVNALFDRMRHVQAPENETIIERIPQNYVVDEAKEVKNPVGSFGRRLSSTFNFILCGNIPMQRLDNALRRLNIRMIKSYPNALAVADSVLTSDEKEEGVAVVNIGSGLTDLTIYYRNVVRYIVSIPMGASAINHDIRSMMIPDKYIERLKRDYGSAVASMVPENKAVRVNGRTPRESKNILLYNLAVAIEARLTMIIEFVKREIADSGYADKLPYGIVITGGSAKLNNIEELFKMLTGLDVRIGTPIECVTEDTMDLVDSPEFSTAVGILLRGAEIGECQVAERPTVTVVPSQPRTFDNLGAGSNVGSVGAVEQPRQPIYTPPVVEPEPVAEPEPQPKVEEVAKPVIEEPKVVEPEVKPQVEQPRVVETPLVPPVTAVTPKAEDPVIEEVEQEPKVIRFDSDVNIDDTSVEDSEESGITGVQSAFPPQDEDEKPKGRNWSKIFEKALTKINESFSSASDSGDEEI